MRIRVEFEILDEERRAVQWLTGKDGLADEAAMRRYLREIGDRVMSKLVRRMFDAEKRAICREARRAARGGAGASETHATDPSGTLGGARPESRP